MQVPELPLVGDDGRTELRETPLGAVVISQTCDLVQANRATVLLAPLIELESGAASDAARGKRPRYVAVPAAGPQAFADLEIISTTTKQYLVRFERKPGLIEDDDGYSKFGRAVGRRFSRFPFPDEVHPWIQPLRSLIQDKAGKSSSPFGQIIKSIRALRLECSGGWQTKGPYNLTLIIALESGVLPELGDDFHATPSELDAWAYQDGRLVRKPAEIARRIQESAGSDVHHLWYLLGESLAEKCREGGGKNAPTPPSVEAFHVEIIDVEELTYDRFHHTEEIDLDHLSPPAPF